MPQGLQVWNAAGVLELDLGTRTGRVVGVIDYTPSSSNPQLVTIPRVSGETCWCYALHSGNGFVAAAITNPAGTALDPNGNTLSISRQGFTSGACAIVYGVA